MAKYIVKGRKNRFNTTFYYVELQDELGNVVLASPFRRHIVRSLADILYFKEFCENVSKLSNEVNWRENYWWKSIEPRWYYFTIWYWGRQSKWKSWAFTHTLRDDDGFYLPTREYAKTNEIFSEVDSWEYKSGTLIDLENNKDSIYRSARSLTRNDEDLSDYLNQYHF